MTNINDLVSNPVSSYEFNTAFIGRLETIRAGMLECIENDNVYSMEYCALSDQATDMERAAKIFGFTV